MTAKAERRGSERPQRESRHAAREAAVQMLYQWEVGRGAIDDVARRFWTDAPRSEAGWETQQDAGVPANLQRFAIQLANGVTEHVATIDPMIAEAAEHWRIERMNVMDRLILRLAVYEFLHESDTPGKVVINEALELARTFSNDDSVRFVNGILDAIRKRLERE